jgi:hypothetical protein
MSEHVLRFLLWRMLGLCAAIACAGLVSWFLGGGPGQLLRARRGVHAAEIAPGALASSAGGDAAAVWGWEPVGGIAVLRLAVGRRRWSTGSSATASTWDTPRLPLRARPRQVTIRRDRGPAGRHRHTPRGRGRASRVCGRPNRPPNTRSQLPRRPRSTRSSGPSGPIQRQTGGTHSERCRGDRPLRRAAGGEPQADPRQLNRCGDRQALPLARPDRGARGHPLARRRAG